MPYLSYIAIGLLVGTFAGSLGLGGGLILIPILVYGFGLTQHQAQGTSLAVMIPPITILAALRYYYSGNVKLGMAAFIACGFLVGGLLGADLVQRVPDIVLRRIFGVIMLAISLRMIFVR
jgi:uncharacterized protein